MSKQPPLFPESEHAPYQRHSATSRAASDALAPRLNAMQATVLGRLRRRGDDGATDDELLVELGWSPNTVRPRRIELVAKKLARDSGRTRLTRTQRKAVVWIATT